MEIFQDNIDNNIDNNIDKSMNNGSLNKLEKDYDKENKAAKLLLSPKKKSKNNLILSDITKNNITLNNQLKSVLIEVTNNQNLDKTSYDLNNKSSTYINSSSNNDVSLTPIKSNKDKNNYDNENISTELLLKDLLLKESNNKLAEIKLELSLVKLEISASNERHVIGNKEKERLRDALKFKMIEITKLQNNSNNSNNLEGEIKLLEYKLESTQSNLTNEILINRDLKRENNRIITESESIINSLKEEISQIRSSINRCSIGTNNNENMLLSQKLTIETNKNVKLNQLLDTKNKEIRNLTNTLDASTSQLAIYKVEESKCIEETAFDQLSLSAVSFNIKSFNDNNSSNNKNNDLLNQLRTKLIDSRLAIQSVNEKLAISHKEKERLRDALKVKMIEIKKLQQSQQQQVTNVDMNNQASLNKDEKIYKLESKIIELTSNLEKVQSNMKVEFEQTSGMLVTMDSNINSLLSKQQTLQIELNNSVKSLDNSNSIRIGLEKEIDLLKSELSISITNVKDLQEINNDLIDKSTNKTSTTLDSSSPRSSIINGENKLLKFVNNELISINESIKIDIKDTSEYSSDDSSNNSFDSENGFSIQELIVSKDKEIIDLNNDLSVKLNEIQSLEERITRLDEDRTNSTAAFHNEFSKRRQFEEENIELLLTISSLRSTIRDLEIKNKGIISSISSNDNDINIRISMENQINKLSIDLMNAITALLDIEETHEKEETVLSSTISSLQTSLQVLQAELKERVENCKLF
jgi:hypothetical protein